MATKPLGFTTAPAGQAALSAGPSDRQLLEQFLRQKDEGAFAVLVQRHGPMVLSVCRRILSHVQDAEDAFQATFLVLARKAQHIAQPELLGSWLYGVAFRVARKARAQAALRRQRESEKETAPMSAPDPLLEAAWRELRASLDEELRRLPIKYQAPLVLCYLEGLTNEEAAQRLGWPTGSISYRLARGRELLRSRLSRRRPVISPALLPVLLAGSLPLAELPAGLAVRTARAALALTGSGVATAGLVSRSVTDLAAAAVGGWKGRTFLLAALFALALVLGAFSYAALAGEIPWESFTAPWSSGASSSGSGGACH
jgi:RNA polymerase sigma factor (sigma-70 family)